MLLFSDNSDGLEGRRVGLAAHGDDKRISHIWNRAVTPHSEHGAKGINTTAPLRHFWPYQGIALTRDTHWRMHPK
jgi:hypothetical protein